MAEAKKISVVSLVMSLRYALGDMQGLNISDYELIEPINQAIHKLYSYLSERHIREVVEETTPTQISSTNTKITLPDTFIRICQVLGAKSTGTAAPSDDEYKVIIPTTHRKKVFGAYRLIGREITAENGWYIVEYYYIPEKKDDLVGDYNVPESMRTWIEQLALAYYRKDYPTADRIVRQCENVLAGREVTQFENSGVSQTLGARAAAQ